MLDNLVFSLNATVPVFLLMVLGLFLHRIGWMDDRFASYLNGFVFHLPLPVLLFRQLATVRIVEVWDAKFVVFCFAVTFLSVLIALLCSLPLRERALRGEFIQASYRSSAALLGVSLIMNMYGTGGMAPLMIIGAVPLYNVMAVLVLMVTAGEGKLDGALLRRTLRNVLLNPIIDGIALGFVWSALRIPMPAILDKFTSNVGALATPLGLTAMGATFSFKKALGRVKPALSASFLKLFGFEILFLPLAVSLGFRTEKLVAILVMLGSATTVSCYVMAKAMGHEGVLSSSCVMLTTMLSAFSLTFWIFLMRSMGFI